MEANQVPDLEDPDVNKSEIGSDHDLLFWRSVSQPPSKEYFANMFSANDEQSRCCLSYQNGHLQPSCNQPQKVLQVGGSRQP
jgi:hypothetical protein